MSDPEIGYLAADNVGYKDPAVFAPPKGVKLILLTEGGVAVLGDWKDDGGFVAWSPLPKKTIQKEQP